MSLSLLRLHFITKIVLVVPDPTELCGKRKRKKLLKVAFDSGSCSQTVAQKHSNVSKEPNREGREGGRVGD